MEAASTQARLLTQGLPRRERPCGGGPHTSATMLLLQALYSVRSERLLMEQLDYNQCSVGSWA